MDGGSPVGVDLVALRRSIIAAQVSKTPSWPKSWANFRANLHIVGQFNTFLAAQPDYRDPEVTDPAADPATAASEVEYRAAMGLDQPWAVRSFMHHPAHFLSDARSIENIYCVVHE